MNEKTNAKQVFPHERLVGAQWRGMDDDWTLERYGMLAHVECMNHGHWWFAISRLPSAPGAEQLYNHADQKTHVHLQTGQIARVAAECCLELLHVLRPNAEVQPEPCSAERPKPRLNGNRRTSDGTTM